MKSIYVNIEYSGMHQKRPGDYGADLRVDGVYIQEKYMT